MDGVSKCPICGGGLEERVVEHVVSGGGHTATLSVPAQVCQKCGEELYSLDTVELFDRIRARLKNNQTDGFELIGQSFRVNKEPGILTGEPVSG
jgi:YgiT-type zinc finger domain-containing protein